MPAKLVAIGDSLTQGFQSGSIFKTQFSFPAMIAQCLSLKDSEFKQPDFRGATGLPLNLEALLRLLADRYGDRINWYEFAFAVRTVQSFMDQIEDYWERGDGSRASSTGPFHHNLAVWGFQLSDSYQVSEQSCRPHIPPPTDALLRQIPEQAQYRTARRVLNPSFSPQYQHLTQVGVAQQIAEIAGGIDNLIFWLGSNHCLGTVVELAIKLSEPRDIDQLPHQRTANLWRPEHFQQVLDRATAEVAQLKAKHVFIANVPHVTIPPVSRGVSPGAVPGQEQDSEGYFEFYTNFWIWDEAFSPGRHAYLTRTEVRQIDATIDQYNQMIQYKAQQLGWHVVDICSLLDRLAFRRRQGNITYQFPLGLVAALSANPTTQDRVVNGQPLLDSRYPRVDLQQSDPTLKYKGGLFGLDGIHPGTIAYGVVAHEFLQVMQQVWKTAGEPVVLQPLDWSRIVASDTLVTSLPGNLGNLQDIFGFLYSQTPLPELLKLIGGVSA
jgi:hypothetical protein